EGAWAISPIPFTTARAQRTEWVCSMGRRVVCRNRERRLSVCPWCRVARSIFSTVSIAGNLCVRGPRMQPAPGINGDIEPVFHCGAVCSATVHYCTSRTRCRSSCRLDPCDLLCVAGLLLLSYGVFRSVVPSADIVICMGDEGWLESLVAGVRRRS